MMDQDSIRGIVALARQAGGIILHYYQKVGLNVDIKADKTPVTEADKASSRCLIEGLGRLFPDDPVISEESGLPSYAVRSRWERFWLVDPLDGTKEFIRGNGQFCINIALIEGNKPVFGLIYNVLSGEIAWTGEGRLMWDGRKERVKQIEGILSPEGTIRLAVSLSHQEDKEQEYVAFLESRGYVVEVVAAGASSKQMMVAGGKADIALKYGRCSEWDVAAGHALVEAAGGLVMNALDGSELVYNKPELLNPPYWMCNARIKRLILNEGEIFLNFGR